MRTEEKKLSSTGFKRKIYFKKVDFEKAEKILDDKLKQLNIILRLKKETVKTENSIGRITATPIYAKKSVPSFSSSAMDGIAVRAEDTKFVSPKNPKKLYKDKDFQYINTGFPIPSGFNAVIKIEDVNIISEDVVEIEKSVPFFNNVRQIGEDVQEGEMILPSYFKITPECSALLYSSGIYELEVLKKPKAALLPTGSEIVKRGEKLKKGTVYETNSIFIEHHLKEMGFNVHTFEPEPDIISDLENLTKRLVKEYDLLFILSGTSSGEKDYSPAIIEKLGKIHFHGVNYIPGKPFCFGEIEKKPVFCIPGFPGAAAGVVRDFIKKASFHFTLYDDTKESIKAYSAFNIPLKLGMKEFLKVKVGKVKGEYTFYPLKRGSSVLKPFIEKDGLLISSPSEEGVNENEVKNIMIFKRKELIEKNIVFIGSNDFLIYELRNFLRKKDYELDLTIIHTGSLGGIFALKKEKTNLTGIHLFDPEEEMYNLTYIKKHLKGKKIVLMNLSYRSQGILVKKGNPKNIKSLKDLTRSDVTFINRQLGSGTRILLDYLLKKEEINKEEINGYEREVFTHLEAGISVNEGEADCAVGIYPVSKILDLEFIEIGKEKYDLIFEYNFFNSNGFNLLNEIINSKAFEKKANELGGYDLKDKGKIEILNL